MKKNIKVDLLGIVAGAMVLASATLPAFAADLGVSVSGSANVGVGGTAAGVQTETEVHGGTTGGGRVSALIERAKSKADEEIGRRIKALGDIQVRLDDMQKLSDSEKASISADVKAQIDAMTALQAKITTDVEANATSAVREDIKSITAAYRIFVLILPRAAITAAADRVSTTASSTAALAVKLQARIADAQSAGADMSASVTALADMNAKISDANAQAQAAVTEVAGLTPDNGDQTKFKANKAALKDARDKVQAAQKDLVAAREDARAIVKALKKADVKVNASTTASSSVGTNGDH